MLYLIVAKSKNNVIGKDNEIPWKSKEDMTWFRLVTEGHPVFMGYNTFLSIGHSLPKRKNYLLKTPETREQRDIQMYVEDQIEELIKDPGKIIFCIGGASTYRKYINRASKLFVTEIQEEIAGDTFFPKIPENFVEKISMRTEEEGLKITIYESK